MQFHQYKMLSQYATQTEKKKKKDLYFHQKNPI